MPIQHAGARSATPTLYPLHWIPGITAATATVLLALGLWHVDAAEAFEGLMIPGLTVVDGPLVQGPLISLGDLFRDIQIGQFQ